LPALGKPGKIRPLRRKRPRFASAAAFRALRRAKPAALLARAPASARALQAPA